MDRKRQTLKAYASHVSKLCPKNWTANKLHTKLCNSTSPLTSKKVDLNRPCTDSETQFCHIYDELSLWNEVLCHCHMQIKEVAPKELAISAFHGRSLEPGTAAKYALVLVHWLLKEHHCLKALRIQGSVILENSELLCDALRLAVGLKSLEIWGKHNIRKFYRPVIARQRLLRTIGTLAGLEELKLNCVLLSSKELAILKTAFENMTCLRSFVVTNIAFDVSMASKESFPLMEGLKCCKTITELYLGCSYLCEVLSTALAEYLGDNCTLRVLTIDLPSLGGALHREELAPMLGALARNKALQKLHLIGYPLFELQHHLVVEAMTANQTLQSLHITNEWSWFWHKNFPDIIKNNSGLLELALEGPISEEVKSFTEAVRVNKTMQKLSLNWSGVSVCDTKEFCSALAKNQSLQMVIMSKVDEKLVEGVYNVSKETGTEHRVHFTSIFKSALVLQGALENCSELTEVCYCPALHATVRTEDDYINSSDSSSEDDDGEGDNTDDDYYHGDDGNTDDDIDYLSDDGNTDDDDDYLRDSGNTVDDGSLGGDGYTDDEDNPLGDGNAIDDDSLGDDNSVDDDTSSYDDNENSDDHYRILNIGNNRVIKDVAPEIPTFRCLNTSKHFGEACHNDERKNV
uniref:Putative hiv-1 vpr-binding protein n=1 Tax=Ixodes ricinus TaxID=34613 RepID=V5HXI3_IXORI